VTTSTRPTNEPGPSGRPMDWARLLEVVEMASRRIRRDTRGKPDRGYQWVCYCVVCREIRRAVT
jgi:hypothetical protein